MSKNYTGDLIFWGLAAVLIAVVAAPIFLLYAGAAVWQFSGSPDTPAAAVNLALLTRSLGYSFVIASLCLFLGGVIAVFTWTLPAKAGRNMMAAIMAGALIPPFIHIHSWIGVMDFINSAISGWTGISPNFSGSGAMIWVCAVSYLPFTAAVVLMGLHSIPVETLEYLYMEGRFLRAFPAVILPQLSGFFAAGFLFVFLLTINDYAVASAFAVNVYALELFALFSAGGGIYSIAVTALPLFVLALALLAALARIAGRLDFRESFVFGAKNPLSSVLPARVCAYAGGVMAGIFAGVPLVATTVEIVGAAIVGSMTDGMTAGSGTAGLPEVLADSAGQIAYSVGTSALAAAMAAVPAALFAYARSIRGKGRGTDALLALPFLIPSSILGLALIAVWNTSMLSPVYTSPIMPAIGLAIRFIIIPVLFMSFRFDRIDKELLGALHLESNTIKGFFHVILPMIGRDIIICMTLVFAIAMSEYGLVLLITPPGFQMITIKIYNYIHYGASEIVTALNLVVLLSTALAILIIMKLQNSRSASLNR